MAPEDLQHFISRLEADESLLAPMNLCRRLDTLDRLDALFPDSAEPIAPSLQPDAGCAAISRRTRELRHRLEKANDAIYRSIRSQIRRNGSPEGLLQWLQRCGTKKGTVVSGLGYDHCDDLVSGVLAIQEPAVTALPPRPGMVFYQPTPVRHILRMIRGSRLAADDVLVDLGSGLGHVPLLASVLTGARSIGIEIEPGYVSAARACVRSLRLRRVSFVQSDARIADLSAGSVFFLYTPFMGAILKNVLQRLRRESLSRPIRVCTFGPCTLELAGAKWLRPMSRPAVDRVTCFRSIR